MLMNIELILLLFCKLLGIYSLLLDSCYSAGNNCVRFERSETTHPENGITKTLELTNASIGIDELFGYLGENRSFAALVVDIGTRKNVQWKISPDLKSEHPIEIRNDQMFEIADGLCYDFEKNEGKLEKVFIVPPTYRFQYSLTGDNTSINCSTDALTIIPFSWNAESRSSVRGMSYFSLTNCVNECLPIRIETQIAIICPKNEQIEQRTHAVCPQDFTAEISDDLFGIIIRKSNPELNFPIGIVDCEAIVDKTLYGENAICLGDSENVAIKFGANATIQYKDTVKITPSEHKIMLKMPRNAVYPNFTVSYPTEIGKCSTSVKFEVKRISGNGYQPLSFRWTVLNGTDKMILAANSTNDRFLEFDRQDLSNSNQISVTGCNLAGRCTTSEPLYTGLSDDSSVFYASIEGHEIEAPNSVGVKLHAQPFFQECNSNIFPKDVQYEWQINGISKAYEDGLKLPAFEYEVDEFVNITLIAQYNQNKYFQSTVSKIIHYIGLPLLVTLDCCQKHVALDQELVIRAIAKDQNSKNSKLKFNWRCQYLDGDNATCDINNINLESSVLTVPAGYLKAEKSMNFTVTVSSENVSDSASCIVTVGSNQLPNIYYFHLAEKKQSANNYMRVQALVSSSYEVLNITWEIVKDSNFGYINISSIVQNPTTIIDNLVPYSQLVVSLTIPPASQINSGLLSTGQTFVIRLWATDNHGTSFSDLYLNTNSPPTLGKIDITSQSEPFVALDTPITFSVGDGWNDDKDDFPLSYQFGYRTVYLNGSTSESWSMRSTLKSQTFYFASTGSNGNSSCEHRIGYSAMLTVCDRLESCTTGYSEMFNVTKPENITLAIMNLVNIINSEILNENLISAISMIHAMCQEICEPFDVKLSNQVSLLLFQSLYKSSEKNEYQVAVNAASLLLPTMSQDTLEEFLHMLSAYRKLNLGEVSDTRSKRSATEESPAKVYEATESEANDMLKVYDILISKSKPVIDVYFLNIDDFLTGFCVQLDENSDRIMSAEGNEYTKIQSQSVSPTSPNYKGIFDGSGQIKPSIIFSDDFKSSYTLWNCGASLNSTCRHVCLGTSWVSRNAIVNNSYMNDYLFSDQNYLTVNKSVSDLYLINLVDPLSGVFLKITSGSMLYNIKVPINNYKTINYYDCFIFNQPSGWDYQKCTSTSYATNINNTDFITCNCSVTGLLGVFSVSGPPPEQLPARNEILLTIILNIDVSTDDVVKIMLKISQLSEVDYSRFVQISNKGSRTITATLRPPFRTYQKSNSYAVQAIQRVIGAGQLLGGISVRNFTYQSIVRNLAGDYNARKIVINFARSYLSELGSETDDYVKKWITSLATTLQISEYRLKNAKIFFGIVFNLTITVPFSDEINPLRSEEIALMIQECANYDELDFQLQSEAAKVNKIPDTDIVKLIVLRETNALMLSLIIVLSTVLGTGTLFIGGAVIVKIRTDRLIEDERRRAILNEQFRLPPPPEYANSAGVFPVVNVGENRNTNNNNNHTATRRPKNRT